MFYKWINISLITYKFYVTIKNLNTRENDIRNMSDKTEERDYIKKSRYVMYAFPLILIVFKFSSIIKLIFFMFKINDDIFTEENFLYVESICEPLIGFFNSLLFLFIHRRYF